ncbi:cellulase family glycosylhydrolase [Aquihabitans sp. G128]|uniref:cellulase family glycosylhydrolase n=1 Tax=Aquihabitans sp. G128 TaxID=2849779 RepID=UPI001C215B41|nr:cellulase family glycosylhydrolase [Aquihabitans sp. G128]QXC59638.1 cellulase family glycosylhydrolase [Aquihabitans sp. G128]
MGEQRSGARRWRSIGVAALAAGLAVGGPVAQAAPDGPARVGRVAPAPDAHSTAGWTTTTGTDGRTWFADAQGRARQVRGINIKSRDLPADASDARLAATAAAGFDLIRISVYWDQFEPTQGTYDQAYFDGVRTVLARAEAHGLKVILDMHQDNFGAAFGSNGIPVWATRSDGLPFVPQDVWFLNAVQPALMRAWQHLYEDADLRQAQVDAWLEVVDQVGSEPAVFGYDLLNEPFGELRAGETLQEAVNRIEGGQLSDLYQRLTDAIRTVDTERWIFVEPANEASLGLTPALRKIHGTKVAYYPHMYDSAIETATYGGGTPVLNEAFFTRFRAAIVGYPQRNHVPMIFGEWGVSDASKPGMEAFIDRSVALMDEIGSGWTAFYFDPASLPDPGFDQIIQPWAQAVAGAPTSAGFDTATRRLRVVFADDDATGPTDLVVPPAYADGWKVVTSDADGTWSAEPDPVAGVIHVTTAKTGGAHAVCLVPEADATPCPVVLPDPAPAPTPTTTAPAATGPGTAAPATPVAGRAAYTG